MNIQPDIDYDTLLINGEHIKTYDANTYKETVWKYWNNKYYCIKTNDRKVIHVTDLVVLFNVGYAMPMSIQQNNVETDSVELVVSGIDSNHSILVVDGEATILEYTAYTDIILYDDGIYIYYKDGGLTQALGYYDFGGNFVSNVIECKEIERLSNIHYSIKKDEIYYLGTMTYTIVGERTTNVNMSIEPISSNKIHLVYDEESNPFIAHMVSENKSEVIKKL